jgi:hypothetical protein
MQPLSPVKGREFKREVILFLTKQQMNKLIFRLFLLIVGGVFLFIYAFPWNSYNIEVPFS